MLLMSTPLASYETICFHSLQADGLIDLKMPNDKHLYEIESPIMQKRGK